MARVDHHIQKPKLELHNKALMQNAHRLIKYKQCEIIRRRTVSMATLLCPNSGVLAKEEKSEEYAKPI